MLLTKRERKKKIQNLSKKENKTTTYQTRSQASQKIKQKLKAKTSLIGGTEAKDNVNRACRFSIYETEY